MATTIHIPPRLLIADSVIARVQDQLLLRVLRPIISWLETFPERFTTANRPPANAAQAGVFIRVKDTNMPETLQCCLQQTTGAYEWVTLGVASR